jgi:C4-type Zn-finger protein
MAVATITAIEGTLNKLTDFSTSLIAATATDGFTITSNNWAQTVLWISNTNTGSSAAATLIIAASTNERAIAKDIGALTTSVNDYAIIGPLESGRFESTGNTITIAVTSTVATNVSCAAFRLR